MRGEARSADESQQPMLGGNQRIEHRQCRAGPLIREPPELHRTRLKTLEEEVQTRLCEARAVAPRKPPSNDFEVLAGALVERAEAGAFE